MKDLSIEELARKAADGDDAAFDALIRTQLTRLEIHVRGRIGPKVRATVEPDDVVQETVLKACRAIHNFVWSGEEPFFRWLARIAEHVIWKVSQKKLQLKLSLEPIEGRETAPLTLAAREERHHRLERSISELSDDHQQVIRLTRLEGLKIAEVAGRMDRTPNAVKKLLARALGELRKRYGESSGSLLIASPHQNVEKAENSEEANDD